MKRWLKYCLFILLLPGLMACDSVWNDRLALKSVDQPAMEALVQELGWVLVDVRDSNWYSGWPSGNDTEGGHIPGARNFDLAWMEADPGQARKLLFSKGISPDNSIVVYGRDKQDAQVLAQWLVDEQGFSEDQIRVFEEGFSAWLARGGKPAKLPVYERVESTLRRLGITQDIFSVVYDDKAAAERVLCAVYDEERVEWSKSA